LLRFKLVGGCRGDKSVVATETNQLEELTVATNFPFWLIPFGMMGLPFLWALFELLSTPKVDRSALRMREMRAA
jgi:hypothetical protein